MNDDRYTNQAPQTLSLEQIRENLQKQHQEQEWEEDRALKREFILCWFGQEFLTKVEAAFPDVRLFLEGEPVHPLEIEAKRIYDGQNPALEQDNFDAIAVQKQAMEGWADYFSEKLGITIEVKPEDYLPKTEEQRVAQAKALKASLRTWAEQREIELALENAKKVVTFPYPDAAASDEVPAPA